jgi:hypothetical protein
MLTRTTSVVNIGYRRADKEIRSNDCVDAIWNFRVWMNAPLGCLDEPQTCPSILLSVWCRHPLLVTGSDLVTSRTDRHTKGGSPHWSCRQQHHSIRPPPPPTPQPTTYGHSLPLTLILPAYYTTVFTLWFSILLTPQPSNAVDAGRKMLLRTHDAFNSIVLRPGVFCFINSIFVLKHRHLTHSPFH